MPVPNDGHFLCFVDKHRKLILHLTQGLKTNFKVIPHILSNSKNSTSREFNKLLPYLSSHSFSNFMKSLILILLTVTFLSTKAQPTVNDITPDHWIIPADQGDDFVVHPVPADLKGKVVLLDFWFTQCAPCVVTIPDLNELAKNNPDLVVLSITYNTDADIQKFLKSHLIDYPIGIDVDKNCIKKFKFEGYPHTYLFDRSGKMVWDGVPYFLPIELIYKTLGRNELINTLRSSGELPQETKSYYMSVTPTNLTEDIGTFSATGEKHFVAYNYSAPKLIENIYGYSGHRIICTDSTLNSEKYDLRFKYYEPLKKDQNARKVLVDMLPDRFGFKVTPVKKSVPVNELSVSDTAKLSAALTKHPGGTTFNMYNDTLQLFGTNLSTLANKLENHYKLVFTVPKGDKYDYDFYIPRNDVDKMIATLSSKYGITVSKKEDVITFWQIAKN